MSMRLEMLQVARLAPKLLDQSAELVVNFIQRQQNADGGFKNRAGESDLYYTVFGLECLLALRAQVPVEPVTEYLTAFGQGEYLDLVHLAALARCWSICETIAPNQYDHARRNLESKQTLLPAGLLSRLEQFRSRDGGYHPKSGSECGTAYAAFLAAGAYQDLHSVMPAPMRLAESLERLVTPDGAWANERGLEVGATNATAAMVTLLRNISIPVPSAAGDWLLARVHAQGGFLAAPASPIPDLLSTATALHALAGLQRDLSAIQERCLDYLDTLWTNEGGFYGFWNDETLDCEYTYYGLLALGHLSLWNRANG